MVYSAIFGFNPSKGARSPIIWNQLYKGLGIEGRMIAVDCETEEDFKKKFTKLSSDEDFQGGAIAAPYKELACQLTSPSDNVFRDIGSVNCIYRGINNYLNSTNTDAVAAINEISKLINLKLDINVLFMGFGGTGKAVASLLRDKLTVRSSIKITCRSKPNHILLNKDNVIYIPWEKRSDFIESSDLIVNCTSMGDLNNLNLNPFEASWYKKIKDKTAVYDVIYNPKETLFLKGLAKNVNSLNGEGMNKSQALIAFQYCNQEFSMNQINSISLEL